jgi:hypothetical protein
MAPIAGANAVFGGLRTFGRMRFYTNEATKCLISKDFHFHEAGGELIGSRTYRSSDSRCEVAKTNPLEPFHERTDIDGTKPLYRGKSTHLSD